MKHVLDSLQADIHSKVDLTLLATSNKQPPPSVRPSLTAHLDQLHQSTQCFDRGLGHGPLHRHVHVHGGFDNGADAVCIQDTLEARENTGATFREGELPIAMLIVTNFFVARKQSILIEQKHLEVKLSIYLQKHITSTVQVLGQLATFVLLGQE